MKNIDVKDVAQDLARACRYYVGNAFEDRLSGVVRSEMERQLGLRGMSDVVEFVEPAALFVDTTDTPGRLLMQVGNTNWSVTRQVTAKYSVDVDYIRTRPEQFVGQVIDEVAKYVSSIPANACGATVPALYVAAEAYMITLCMWGYVAVPTTNSLVPVTVSEEAVKVYEIVKNACKENNTTISVCNGDPVVGTARLDNILISNTLNVNGVI